jgi:hypothetical protein
MTQPLYEIEDVEREIEAYAAGQHAGCMKVLEIVSWKLFNTRGNEFLRVTFDDLLAKLNRDSCAGSA